MHMLHKPRVHRTPTPHHNTPHPHPKTDGISSQHTPTRTSHAAGRAHINEGLWGAAPQAGPPGAHRGGGAAARPSPWHARPSHRPRWPAAAAISRRRTSGAVSF
eukprot:2769328-Prymnesium_polylepis.2